MGLNESNARFIDLPFYQTGRIKKKPVGEEDARIILDLMSEQNPGHIFVAGDLSDPHGTHPNLLCCDPDGSGTLQSGERETGAKSVAISRCLAGMGDSSGGCIHANLKDRNGQKD